MKYDQLQALESLGTLNQYRQAGEVEKFAATAQTMLESLEAELEKQPSETQRAVFVLEVLERMLLTARERSCDHEISLCTACENIDIYHVMGEWLTYGKKLFAKGKK